MELLHLSPILWTKNLQETIVFYETVLGFKSKSNFPNFASLTKDGVEIMFVIPKEDLKEGEVLNVDTELFPQPMRFFLYVLPERVHVIHNDEKAACEHWLGKKFGVDIQYFAFQEIFLRNNEHYFDTVFRK